MRRHAANIFNYRNHRRGEWNPLLLVMFALLTVAPSVLAAAPLHQASTQPQAVWQWLQSPEGAPARDLIQQTLIECGMPNAECGILNSPGEFLIAHCDIDSPLSHLDDVAIAQSALDEPVAPFPQFSILNSQFLIRSLSSHEAALLSGIRTNRRRN
ncbi:MAG TPA: hypothetical protein VGB77_01225 [Abditibacteriaceae bacterium]|jgi:hypothetical protein